MRTHSLFPPISLKAAALVLAVTAAGCAAVGPNYERPKLEPPALYRDATPAPTPESVADLPWWQLFSDPALHGLIREGVANNLDLKLAAARVVESRALAGVAKSYLYPEVGVGFGTKQEQVSRVGDPKASEAAVPDRTYSNWALNGTLSWEIDLFGRIRRGKEAAVAQYLASEEGKKAVLVTLVADIASTYHYLRELNLDLEIARRTVKINEDTVVYYERRLQGGVSNRLEVDQAKANRANTAAAIPNIERQVAIAENALSVLVGRVPGSVARFGPLGESEVPPDVPSGLPAQLLERRPDIRQAEQLLVAANANIGVARALFFPTIGLTGSAGAISSSLSDFLTPQSMIWSFGAGLLQPIFNGGRLKNNYEAAKARYDQALAQYQRSALNAYREVADALVTIQKLAEQRRELQSGVDALRDATTLARSRYDNGLSSYLEVLLADQYLFSAELQLAAVRGSQLRAVTQLYRALGGGWQLEPAPPQTAPAPSVK
ncbi:MAG: efflux transporter outer membrane subunit [Acidobacteria bacterium]|nr:efflux transporter outer membrane subunit [Acidobacteriota bacterium]